jgi:hypothetical protein
VGGEAVSDVAELRPSDAVNLAGQNTGREHLSHSGLALQLACLQKHHFHYGERLQLIEGPRALGMGKAFQKAIELQDPDAGATALRDATPAGYDQAAIDRLRIEEATVRAAAALYLRRWPAPVDGAETREFEYRVRLRNPWTGHYSQTFDLLGYADGVTDAGAYWELIENKFVGRIDAVTIRKLKLDRQVSLACYGLWRATGKPVRVVRYRFVKKPSIKPWKATKNKPAETTDEFIERLTADYEKRTDFYSHPEDLFRDEADLLRMEQELWVWADELRAARRRDLFPRNTSHCSDYGGCQFIPLCVGDPDARSLYRVRPHHQDDDDHQEAQAA